jgi:hypothetical protein
MTVMCLNWQIFVQGIKLSMCEDIFVSDKRSLKLKSRAECNCYIHMLESAVVFSLSCKLGVSFLT